MPVPLPAPRAARRHRWWGALLAAALAGLGGALRAAEDQPAPPPSLDEIKNDLREIKRAETTPGDGSSTLSKVALPALRTGSDSAPAPAARPAPPADAGPRANPNANWLLQAMAPRSGDGRGQTTGGSEPGAANLSPGLAGAPGDQPPARPSDPNFMLRTYLAQKPAGDASAPARPEWDLDPMKTDQLGSFGRYLGEWVSPRDPALRGLIAAAAAPAPGSVPLAEIGAGRQSAPRAAAEEPANPFLATLTTDFISSPPLPALAPPAAPPPAELTPPPAPAVTPAANRPPPNPADEKKYFPQLNRF